MIKNTIYNFKGIVIVLSMTMLFFSCKDTYERVGEEAKEKVFPQGIAHNFKLTYTEVETPIKKNSTATSKVVAVLTSETCEDYDNLKFPYKTFPNGLHVAFFDENNKKSTVVADYGIIYSAMSLIDLQGNVVLESHDGKKIETPQLYWDQQNEWMFTQDKFRFTNPEDGTVMDGEGMDFNKNIVNAHRTYGIMTIKNEE